MVHTRRAATLLLLATARGALAGRALLLLGDAGTATTSASPPPVGALNSLSPCSSSPAPVSGDPNSTTTSQPRQVRVSNGAACEPDMSGVNVFTCVWISAVVLLICVGARLMQMRMCTRANAASASAAAAPGASPALTEKHSWRVRTGWRVELPDGTFLAAVETSIRGGLGGGPRRAVSHCPSVGSAGADSLGTAAGGASDGVVPGDSLRAALDALSTLDAAPPPAPSAEPPPPTGGGEAASQATPLPEWRGWRLATGPIDTPPPLAALHAAQAAQQAQAERAHGGTAAAHTAGHAQST